MKFTDFTYRGSWLKKLGIYLLYQLPNHYLANDASQVPYYRSVLEGSKCYMSDYDVVVELRGDRWFALGESAQAKALNQEIDFYAEAAKEITEAEILVQIQKMTGNQGVADRIIQAELDKVGVVLGPFKES